MSDGWTKTIILGYAENSWMDKLLQYTRCGAGGFFQNLTIAPVADESVDKVKTGRG
jgi:hypothetical protein